MYDKMDEYIHPHIESEALRVFMCMHIMVTNASTRRWTLTPPKFDEPFDPRLHFEIFGGTDIGWCEGHTPC